MYSKMKKQLGRKQFITPTQDRLGGYCHKDIERAPNQYRQTPTDEIAPSLREADRAYKMGYTAAKNDFKLEANPYGIAQMQLHSSWAAGWHDQRAGW